MRMATTTTVRGIIAGPIWQPGVTCAKTFGVRRERYADGAFKHTLKEIIDKVCIDGDFSGCKVIDASVTVVQSRLRGSTLVSRSRSWDIRQFSSVRDYVVEYE